MFSFPLAFPPFCLKIKTAFFAAQHISPYLFLFMIFLFFFLKQILCNIRRSQGRDRTRSLKFVLKGHLSVFYLYSTWKSQFWTFFRHFQLRIQVPGLGGQISKVILIFQNLYQIVQFDELSRMVQYFSDPTFLSQVTTKNYKNAKNMESSIEKSTFLICFYVLPLSFFSHHNLRVLLILLV